MCGGDIQISADNVIGTCLFCGSTLTLPRIDSEKKARLFNRANQYRQACEFDKAYRRCRFDYCERAGVYSRIEMY